MRQREGVLAGSGSGLYLTFIRVTALTFLVLNIGIVGCTQTADQREHSHRVHEILEEARSHQAESAKIGAALHEILGRQTKTFAEFEKQCADLRASLAENDAMEKRKRKMLVDLQYEFGGDSKVQPIFGLLARMEDQSDKVEPIWRGMIACSDTLASAAKNRQEGYQSICVDPADQQLDMLIPEMRRLSILLQAEIQKDGSSLPPEFLRSIGQ